MRHDPHILFREEFPRPNDYDPEWVLENQMGPNALWLTEWLCREMDLREGMRVLDLGCGTAMSSIFLAREFRVSVWAADLWVNPNDNWERIKAAGLRDRICPVREEAHALPFAEEFFDAVVSIDAYQYFGTDTLYITYLSRFVRPHGRVGIVVPGWMQPIGKAVPEHLTRVQPNGACFWEDEMVCFQTVDWWRALWAASNRLDVTIADTLLNGWKYWRDFEVAVERMGKSRFPSVAEALEVDGGRWVGFIRLVGTRRSQLARLNLYDPGLMASTIPGQ